MNSGTKVYEDANETSTTVEISMNSGTRWHHRGTIKIYDSRNFDELGNAKLALAEYNHLRQ